MFEGQGVFDANAKIVETLQQVGRLIHHEPYRHSYPHCWRHKSPVIFRATPQWFISMEKRNLRRDALTAIKGVRWIPGWGEQRITSMIETRPDWCISRQRAWGVPLAMFVHKERLASRTRRRRNCSSASRNWSRKAESRRGSH